MTYGMWLSAAGMQVNDYRQSVMANNLANSNTQGFKHDLTIVRERTMESMTADGSRFGHPVLDGMTGGLFVQPTVHTFGQGELEQTGRSLDVALYGDGFLSVRDGDDVRFTRDGRMTTNVDGELVMVSGGGRARMLDESGQPIRVDTSSGVSVNVTRDGRVWQGADEIGRLGIVTFEDKSSLSKIGRGLYNSYEQAPTESTAQLRPGYVERSTLDPVKGLASMIEVTRAYEMNANMISLQDQTIGQAVTTLGRIG
jgi:flagellar basal-body rod protein FlgF